MRKDAVIFCALLFTGALSSVAAKSVQFRFTDTIARSVSVTGSFNQFDPAANPMHRGAYGASTSSTSYPRTPPHLCVSRGWRVPCPGPLRAEP